MSKKVFSHIFLWDHRKDTLPKRKKRRSRSKTSFSLSKTSHVRITAQNNTITAQNIRQPAGQPNTAEKLWPVICASVGSNVPICYKGQVLSWRQDIFRTFNEQSTKYNLSSEKIICMIFLCFYRFYDSGCALQQKKGFDRSFPCGDTSGSLLQRLLTFLINVQICWEQKIKEKKYLDEGIHLLQK